MRTYTPKPDDLSSDWYVIDARGARLGRVATEVATLLRGKHKPTWAPHAAGGDHVIVINASELDVTLRKAEQKIYHRHSGYPGGLRSESLEHMIERDPARVVKKAVKGMLPKSRLGRSMLRNLRVYAGAAHPHAAQQPETRVLPGGSTTGTNAG
ncbi:MAG: 50S ribosomal protein L13 [Acidimicrobiia bacterium]|nr:50S ribosomal protein L13 [Acidimicrobiia bacterium]